MIQKISKAIKNNLATKLGILMFLTSVLVLSLFIIFEIFVVKPITERILKIETEQQIQVIIDSIRNDILTKVDIINLSLIFDGGITIVDEVTKKIAFSHNKTLNHELDFYYRSILNEIIIEDLEKGTIVSDIMNFENGDSILFIGKKFDFNEKNYYFYTYRMLQSRSKFNKMFRLQMLNFIFLLIIIIYVTSLIVNKYLVKPIKSINRTVYSLTNGNYREVPVKGEDELSSLTKSVNILSKKLQEVEVLRRELISNVSHELRSPLVLIRGYAELVKDISWSNKEKREEQLSLIINESIRMSQMVDDIMDYSQLQAGAIKVNKDKYDVIKLIKDEFFIAKKECELYNININLITNGIESKYVYVDSLKFSQIFRNLFNNAINHTFDMGKIDLVITEEDDKLMVEIINIGETIPEEMIDKLFDKYYRVQHQSTRKKGTGIGLSIVKAICELHDFKYGVLSKNNITKFYVVIK